MDDDAVEAEKFYQQVLLLEPGQKAANLYMGGLKSRLGRFQEAAAHFQTALSSGAHDPEILYQLGNCYLGMGDRFAARNLYQQVLELRPESPRALAKLGWIQEAEGEPCRAMALYAQCLALAPDPEVADDVGRRHQKLESRCPGGKRTEG
jgi:Flp pilus assembly protein TadD